MAAEIPREDLDATRSFYDRLSRAYDLISDASEHTARERGLALLAVRAGERILEVGYGTGHALVDLARAVGDDGSVVGIDISSGMQSVAEKRLNEEGLAGRVDLRVEHVPPMSLGDGELDAVFFSFTLELFPPEVLPAVLAETRRVLRPGGRVGVVSMALPPEGEKDSILERAYKWMHRHFPHIVDCRPIDVPGVLEQAGFRVDERAVMEMWTLHVMAAVGRL